MASRFRAVATLMVAVGCGLLSRHSLAQTLTSLTTDLSTTHGGCVVLATATLSSAPASVTSVSLSISDTSLATGPSTITIYPIASSNNAGYQISSSIASQTSVTFTASYNGVQKTATVTLQPAVTNSNFIVQENMLDGSERWKGVGMNYPTSIQAYPSHWSDTKGASDFYLRVSTTSASNYDLDLYRLGYYQGHGGRLVYTLRDVSSADQGHWSTTDTSLTFSGATNSYVQPDFYNFYNTLITGEETFPRDCHWTNTVQIPLSSSWPTGIYLAMLTNDSTGDQFYVPFVIRDENQTADLVFEYPEFTETAYNKYGGMNSYGNYSTVVPNVTPPSSLTIDTSASVSVPLTTNLSVPLITGTAVTFSKGSQSLLTKLTASAASGASSITVIAAKANTSATIDNTWSATFEVHSDYSTTNRPNNTDNGAGFTRCWTAQMAYFLEENGFKVAYTTSNDIDLNLTDLTRFKGFISAGHDEYWSQNERHYLEQALKNSGLSACFFGGNDLFKQVWLGSGNNNHWLATFKGSNTQSNPFAPWDPEVPTPHITGLAGQYYESTQFSSIPLSTDNTKTYTGELFAEWTDGTNRYPLMITDNEGFGNVSSDFKPQVNSASSTYSSWPYQNTGLSTDNAVTRLLGYEIDAQMRTYTLPTSVKTTNLSSTNSTYTTTNGSKPSQAWLNEFGTGNDPQTNFVFTAGTIYWPNALWDYWPNNGVAPTYNGQPISGSSAYYKGNSISAPVQANATNGTDPNSGRTPRSQAIRQMTFNLINRMITHSLGTLPNMVGNSGFVVTPSTTQANPQNTYGGTITCSAELDGASLIYDEPVTITVSPSGSAQATAAVLIAAGNVGTNFHMAVNGVDILTPITVTVDHVHAQTWSFPNGYSGTIYFNAHPAQLSSLTGTTSVKGGNQFSLAANLNGLTPLSNSNTISFSSSDAVVSVPATTTFHSNASGQGFWFSTSTVTTNHVVTITATYHGHDDNGNALDTTATATVTVTP